MKFGYRLFYFLFFFYVIVDLVYWYMGGEPVGVVAIGLSAGLALIIGYYFWFINRDRKSTRLNSSHEWISRMPSSA